MAPMLRCAIIFALILTTATDSADNMTTSIANNELTDDEAVKSDVTPTSAPKIMQPTMKMNEKLPKVETTTSETQMDVIATEKATQAPKVVQKVDSESTKPAELELTTTQKPESVQNLQSEAGKPNDLKIDTKITTAIIPKDKIGTTAINTTTKIAPPVTQPTKIAETVTNAKSSTFVKTTISRPISINNGVPESIVNLSTSTPHPNTDDNSDKHDNGEKTPKRVSVVKSDIPAQPGNDYINITSVVVDTPNLESTTAQVLDSQGQGHLGGLQTTPFPKQTIIPINTVTKIHNESETESNQKIDLIENGIGSNNKQSSDKINGDDKNTTMAVNKFPTTPQNIGLPSDTEIRTTTKYQIPINDDLKPNNNDSNVEKDSDSANNGKTLVQIGGKKNVTVNPISPTHSTPLSKYNQINVNITTMLPGTIKGKDYDQPGKSVMEYGKAVTDNNVRPNTTIDLLVDNGGKPTVVSTTKGPADDVITTVVGGKSGTKGDNPQAGSVTTDNGSSHMIDLHNSTVPPTSTKVIETTKPTIKDIKTTTITKPITTNNIPQTKTTISKQITRTKTATIKPHSTVPPTKSITKSITRVNGGNAMKSGMDVGKNHGFRVHNVRIEIGKDSETESSTTKGVGTISVTEAPMKISDKELEDIFTEPSAENTTKSIPMVAGKKKDDVYIHENSKIKNITADMILVNDKHYLTDKLDKDTDVEKMETENIANNSKVDNTPADETTLIDKHYLIEKNNTNTETNNKNTEPEKVSNLPETVIPLPQGAFVPLAEENEENKSENSVKPSTKTVTKSTKPKIVSIPKVIETTNATIKDIKTTTKPITTNTIPQTKTTISKQITRTKTATIKPHTSKQPIETRFIYNIAKTGNISDIVVDTIVITSDDGHKTKKDDKNITIITDNNTNQTNTGAVGLPMSGLTTREITAAVVGSIIGFWVVLGPIICLVCKLRDRKSEPYQIVSNMSQDAELGITEKMVMTEMERKIKKGKNGKEEEMVRLKEFKEDGETSLLTNGGT